MTVFFLCLVYHRINLDSMLIQDGLKVIHLLTKIIFGTSDLNKHLQPMNHNVATLYLGFTFICLVLMMTYASFDA